MAKVVGIQFQKNGKIYNYDVNNLDLNQSDYVIADTAHGIDLGQVVSGCRELDDKAAVLRKILRIATESDLQTSADNRQKERQAYEICQKKIAEHKLDMKLVSVEYSFDNSKALFYFTANGRVDFRSLVKDLASVFKMRIELRQIGVRDEARMLGGLGPCGRPICCGSFLEEFQPVSIKMAKEQNLSLNPTKISGVCGRLMCCLKYEQDHYEQTRKIMPRVGKEVITPDGTGSVTDLNIVKETVFVRISSGDSSEIKEYPLDKIERPASAAVPQPAPEKTEQPGLQNELSAESNIVSVENVVQSDSKNPETFQKGPRKQLRRGKSGKHNNSDKPGREHHKPENQENPRVNPALGKPVMRENPNRNTVNEHPDHSENKHEASSSWAEAVRKAIDSIN